MQFTPEHDELCQIRCAGVPMVSDLQMGMAMSAPTKSC